MVASRSWDRIAALIALKRYEAAFEIVTDALADEPQNAELLCTCSSLHLILGRRWEAVETAEAGIAAAPMDSMPYAARARAYKSLRHWDRVLESSREAIRLDPANVAAYGPHAHAQLELRQPAAALHTLRAGLRVAPEDTELLRLLSECYYDLERDDDAARVLERLQALDPQDPAVFYLRGRRHQDAGELAQAKKCFLECLRLDPSDEAAAFFLKDAEEQLCLRRRDRWSTPIFLLCLLAIVGLIVLANVLRDG